jgi:hypothetical protein
MWREGGQLESYMYVPDKQARHLFFLVCISFSLHWMGIVRSAAWRAAPTCTAPLVKSYLRNDSADRSATVDIA